ncbi:MAG: Gfo/Idh/MocA family oxidoreductase [Lachnospiraceae bacterium]|nr:Gfo/Idh/MocA family oxidoreductase [Lachnospiraceae bacterium]
MKKVRVGIVGCGKVAHLHAKSFAAIPECEFVAVCNHRLGRAQEFAAQYGVKAYDSVEEMIKDAGVEAVTICTPHPVHAGDAIAAAKLGVHVAVEKPLAIKLSDCDAMIAAAKENNIVASMVCQRRFYQPVVRMKKAIEEGKIGKPILGSVNVLSWRSMDYYHSDPWRGTWEGEGGGVLVNQSVHQLDLLLWYMGEVEELYGMWGTLNHPELEVDDTAVAVLRFKSGALGTIAVSNSQNPGLFGNVRVHGSNGATVGVQTDGGAMFIAGMSVIAEPPVNDLWTVPGEEDMLKTYQKEDSEFFLSVNSETYYHTLQLRDFICAILEGREPLVPFEDGRRAVELFTAVYRSQETGLPVHFPLK